MTTMQKRTIRERLENWGAAYRSSGAYRPERSMTGIICDRMRHAALGNVWSGSNPAPDVDDKDADLVDKAWTSMRDLRHRRLLRWYFITRSNPEFICRRLGIKQRPASVFDIELWRACEDIAVVLDTQAEKNKMP